VAVVFEPSSYEQLSEALVSMKYNFDKAVKKGIISHEDLEKLYTTAKAIYYPKRNYNLVFRNSHLEDRKINSLKKFLAREGRDIKKQDAMEVLNYIKKRINSF
jgi:hypothetical protein